MISTSIQLVRIIAEQVALDPAARTDIGIAANEPRLRIGRLHRPVEERTADIVGIVTIIGPAHALEHARLAVDIGRDGISLCDPERDLACGKRREDDGSQFGKPDPLLDEAGRDPEAFRHILAARPRSRKCLKAEHSSAGFIATRWKFSARLASADPASSSSTST
jgi:hypothetical protein